MTFNDWWIENCIKRGKRKIYADEVEEAWNAGRKAGLLEAAEIAELNHIGVSVRRYCQDTDKHEYSGNIADAIRAKAGEL